MKKIFSTILAGLLLATVSVSAQLISLGNASYGYATASQSITNGGYHLLAGGYPFELTEIQLLSDGTNACTVQFYDDPYGNGKWTNAAYTDRIGYTTNVSNIHTNAEGIIETNTYTSVLWTAARSVAASSNNTFVAVTSLTVPASGVATRVGKWDFSRGITVQTTTNCHLTFSYRRLY